MWQSAHPALPPPRLSVIHHFGRLRMYLDTFVPEVLPSWAARVYDMVYVQDRATCKLIGPL